jgi:DNA-binding beta-propeller fold protein YncE
MRVAAAGCFLLVLLLLGVVHAQVLLVTFHGGESNSAINTVMRYSLKGEELGSALVGAGVSNLRELRGMLALPDGRLLVANAYKDDSRLVLVSNCDASGQRQLEGNFSVFRPIANPGLVHPYGIAMGSDGTVFTTTQDTALLMRFFGATGPFSDFAGQPHPMPSVLMDQLDAGSDFAPGAFAVFGQSTELRGVAVTSDGSVFVADNSDNSVVAFAANGTRLGSVSVMSPLGLLLDEASERLFVSTTAGPVLAFALPALVPAGKFVDDAMTHSSGMALVDSRLFVLAQQQQVR